jgi:hypothetical protein
LLLLLLDAEKAPAGIVMEIFPPPLLLLAPFLP